LENRFICEAVAEIPGVTTLVVLMDVLYRKVIEFARQHPEQYDPEFEKPFQGWVEELDPPATT
jgi:hypothetical protein